MFCTTRDSMTSYISLVFLLYLWFLRVAMAAGFDRGIDVSHHNGAIDWRKVKAAGISFAAAKATEGNHFVDKNFVTNWRGMRTNNIQASAYHYFRGAQTVDTQVANVKKVMSQVDFMPTSDILAIDVEQGSNEGVSPDKMADTLNSLLVELGKTYKKIYIYTNPSYWENKVNWRKYDFSGYNLWIAHPDKQQPTIPSTWRAKGYTWWQYSFKGKVDGVAGDVDLDRKP